jgi:hypothetical protein
VSPDAVTADPLKVSVPVPVYAFVFASEAAPENVSVPDPV